jgi:hypothetical protein
VDGNECYLSDGAGFPTQLIGPAWSDSDGWNVPSRWATIRLADLDGDARVDLCARSGAGFECRLSIGTGFGEVIAGPPLSDADGWDQPERYGTIRMGDIDGDRRLDVCARGADGVRCWRFVGTGFDTTAVVGPALTDADGWGEARYWQTLRLADVTGDGRADVCARGADRVHCWVSDGASFLAPIDGPEWSDAAGWDDQIYYGTLRLAGPRGCRPRFETCNGVDDDCDDVVDEGCGGDDETDASDGGEETSDGGHETSDGGAETSDGGDAGVVDGGGGGCGCRASGTAADGFVSIFLTAALWWFGRRRRCALRGWRGREGEG